MKREILPIGINVYATIIVFTAATSPPATRPHQTPTQSRPFFTPIFYQTSGIHPTLPPRFQCLPPFAMKRRTIRKVFETTNAHESTRMRAKLARSKTERRVLKPHSKTQLASLPGPSTGRVQPGLSLRALQQDTLHGSASCWNQALQSGECITTDQ